MANMAQRSTSHRRSTLQFLGSVLLFSAVTNALPLRKVNPRLATAGHPRRSVSHPAKQLANVFAKYRASLPENLIPVVEASTLVTVTPGPYDARYLCAVQVGGQTLNLNLDTGSSDLWVFSSQLPSSQSSGHTIYDPTNSTTAKEISGATWGITYADGSSASGNVFTDMVKIDNIMVGHQAVEAAQQVSSQLQQDQVMSGILGMGFSNINTVRPTAQQTFLDNALQQGVLQKRLLTIDLKAGKPGSYDFGYIDASKYQGQLTYTPVYSQRGFWNVSFSGYAIGGQDARIKPVSGILDTGTTLLVLDDAVVAEYWSHVQGASYESAQGGYTFPCNATLADFALIVGDYHATVPGAYMNFAPISETVCFGGIQGNSGIGFSIFGDVFLKSQFIVLDQDVPQAGFALKSLSVQGAESNSTAATNSTNNVTMATISPSPSLLVTMTALNATSLSPSLLMATMSALNATSPSQSLLVTTTAALNATVPQPMASLLLPTTSTNGASTTLLIILATTTPETNNTNATVLDVTVTADFLEPLILSTFLEEATATVDLSCCAEIVSGPTLASTSAALNPVLEAGKLAPGIEALVPLANSFAKRGLVTPVRDVASLYANSSDSSPALHRAAFPRHASL